MFKSAMVLFNQQYLYFLQFEEALPKSVILPKISPPAFGCLNWKIHGFYP